MANDIPPLGQIKPEDESQGQKMTIYMPTGAVIVERSELQSPEEATSTKNLPEERHASPNVGSESVQSLGAVINIYTGSEGHGGNVQSQDKVPDIGNADLSDKQVLLRISEVLDLITKRLAHDNQPVSPANGSNGPSEFMRITNWDSEIKNTSLTKDFKAEQPLEVIEVVENKSASVDDNKKVEKDFNSVGHHFDWLHAFNLIYIFMIVLIPLVPSALNTFLNIEVKPALVNYDAAGIYSGDLIIQENVPASALVVGDFITAHNAFTGHFEDVIQISQISTPIPNSLITITGTPRMGQTTPSLFETNAKSEVERVTKSVPYLGAGKNLVDSFIFKSIVGFAIILLNVIVHFRRRRRFRA